MTRKQSALWTDAASRSFDQQVADCLTVIRLAVQFDDPRYEWVAVAAARGVWRAAVKKDLP